MESKFFLKSKTIVGAIVMLGGFLVKEIGLPIEDVELETLVVNLVEIIGLALVVIGRVRAKQSLSL